MNCGTRNLEPFASLGFAAIPSRGCDLYALFLVNVLRAVEKIMMTTTSVFVVCVC